MGTEWIMPLVVWVGKMITFFADNFVLGSGGTIQSAKVARPTIRLVIKVTKKANLRLVRSTKADFQIRGIVDEALEVEVNFDPEISWGSSASAGTC
jgi:hypothetical protein